MKKVLTAMLAFLTTLSLTAVARADVIVTPVERTEESIMQYLPWILVGILVCVTAFLLLKFWKNKK
ncbi:MAG: hypothetical protein K2N78_11835 [Oscillospiraceae bacterium]|nr:hypothetical protein [Oscillospiraceae bacterium]